MDQNGGEQFLADHELRALEQVARTDPTSPALVTLVRAFLAMNRTEEASALAGRIFEAHPDNLEAACLAAQALIAGKKTLAAQVVLRQAARGLKDLAQVLTRLARLFESTGRSEAAVRTSRAASSLIGLDLGPWADAKRPEEPAAETGVVPTATLAALYAAQGHLDKAVQVYEALLRQNPSNLELQEKLALMRAKAAVAAEEFGLTAPAMPAEQPSLPGRVEIQARAGLEIEKEKPPSTKVDLIKRLERLKAAAVRRRETVSPVV